MSARFESSGFLLSDQMFAFYKEGQLKGYLVTKIFIEGSLIKGHLIDFLMDHKEEGMMERLFVYGIKYLQNKGAKKITTFFWGDESIDGVLSRLGFIKQERKIPLILRVNPNFSNMGLEDSNNWYFTMGDSTEIY